MSFPSLASFSVSLVWRLIKSVLIQLAVGNPCGADGGKPVEKEHHEINKQAGKNEPDAEGNRDYYMPFEETYVSCRSYFVLGDAQSSSSKRPDIRSSSLLLGCCTNTVE